MKIIVNILIAIWFAGAIIMTGVYQYERKSECIEREGFIKGLFWCNTDPKTLNEAINSHNNSFVRALLWPKNIIFYNKISEESQNSDSLIDHERFAVRQRHEYCYDLAHTLSRYADIRDSGISKDEAIDRLDNVDVKGSGISIFDEIKTKEILRYGISKSYALPLKSRDEVELEVYLECNLDQLLK